MKFDRNTVIGFAVLAVLFIGYFVYIGKEQRAYQQEKARLDSIAAAARPKPDTSAPLPDTSIIESPAQPEQPSFGKGKQAQEMIVENNLMRVGFSTLGGQPAWVELKNHRDQDSNLVRLASSDFDQFSYAINTGPNQSAQIAELVFDSISVSTGPGGEQIVSIPLSSGDSAAAAPAIVHQYIIPADDYMIGFNVTVSRADRLFTQSVMNFIWQNRAVNLEKDLAYEKQQSQIGYVLDGDYDYHTIGMRSSRELNDPVKWVAVKQQFFNSTLIAKNEFSAGRIDWKVPEEGNVVVEATAALRMSVPGTSATIPFQLYYGPNDYQRLKKYDLEMENLVNLGTGVFAFVKYINRWFVLPVFNLLGSFINNYGIVILLLTIFIRLLISPLTYTSYLSGARMKALRPEIAKLKEKYGGDQQQMSMEQMKLFREAGVNPLGGCIPALLQIPIFFALYSFFNSSVALRGEDFLWATDLASYDVIFEWTGFKIPFYGNHVSLFTITAVITSFMISIYSMSMTPDQSNPVLKYMPYVFPFFLLFIFNSLPSGLTWYYTVSNLITLAMQFVIQNYIIDHEKILARIQENRKKPKSKSKWQERLEQMQETQKKMKEMQQKGKR